MKQNGIICTFRKYKHFFVSLLYLLFIKPTNVSDHFAWHYIYIYIYIYTHLTLYIYVCVCVCVCARARVFVSICVCL